MKVYVLIVDSNTGIYQSGMINEPVSKGYEIQNALGHFGISYGNVEWKNSNNIGKFGEVIGTSKKISIISI